MTPLAGFGVTKLKDAGEKFIDQTTDSIFKSSSKGIQNSQKDASLYSKSSQRKIAEIVQLNKSRPVTPEKSSSDYLRGRIDNSIDVIDKAKEIVQSEERNLKASEEALAKAKKQEEAGSITDFVRSLFSW